MKISPYVNEYTDCETFKLISPTFTSVILRKIKIALGRLEQGFKPFLFILALKASTLLAENKKNF